MEQLSFFSVPSPCVGICQTDPRGYCLGCFRSRDERFNWIQLSEAQKQNVIRLCRQRKRRRQYLIAKHHRDKTLEERAALNPQFDFEEPESFIGGESNDSHK